MKGCHTLRLHPPASPAVSFIPFHRRNCSAIKSTRAWPRKPGPAFSSSRTEMCTQTLAPTVFMESESLPGCYFVHPPLHPPPPLFLIHHFYACFSQITCARLWPWCPAECKCSSAANCLHHMDHQRTPRAQPEHPTGSRVRAAQSSE